MSKSGAERLRRMLARNQAIAEAIHGPEFPLETLETLQEWQQKRIARTYDDLIAQPRYTEAVHFFLTELYGGLHFEQRDHDMARVMPLMVRFLPARALLTLSEAFELQAISLEYDISMARFMAQQDLTQLEMSEYCAVYRNCSDRPGRERQILLIRKLGHDLDRLVRKPLVNYLVRLMRGPAHATGFGELQDFLELGLASFRSLEDAGCFVDIIHDREWAAMDALFSGSDRPFEFGDQ